MLAAKSAEGLPETTGVTYVVQTPYGLVYAISMREAASLAREAAAATGKTCAVRKFEAVDHFVVPEPIVQPKPDHSTIPVGSRGYGHYALVVDGETKFFRVDRPTKGKWTGKTFLKVQAGDDFHKVVNSAGILNRLVNEHAQAAAFYGAEIGHCSRCNRTLTDATSRALGIGPDCRAKD